MCGNHPPFSRQNFNDVGSPPRVREPHRRWQPRDAEGRITPACAGTTAVKVRPEVAFEDHPRVCGNHYKARYADLRKAGSPPRVREPRIPISISILHLGITPACAGTTRWDRDGTMATRDHPRVCGNHSSFSSSVMFSLGSPPRVREPHRRWQPRDAEGRITPACAGTTGLQRCLSGTGEDHPRVCGNHKLPYLHRHHQAGSPPRVREPQLRSGFQCAQRRITPACAGTTSFELYPINLDQDHPRVCGNHQGLCPGDRLGPGSPPRVREPQFKINGITCVRGITPACAGTTILRDRYDQLEGDHPRVCGNHDVSQFSMYDVLGSPPRVREPLSKRIPDCSRKGITPACAGTTASWEPLMSFIANLQLIRITPACAGTTSVFLSPRISTWDHPRVCGNHLLIIVAIIAVMGSPPRVREPLEYERRADGRDGITPACAGTTSTCLRPSGNRRDHPRVCGNHQ